MKDTELSLQALLQRVEPRGGCPRRLLTHNLSSLFISCSLLFLHDTIFLAKYFPILTPRLIQLLVRSTVPA